MSRTDSTYECSHCERSVPNGGQCGCQGAQRHVVQAGHPNGPGVDMHSGDPTERDGLDINPDES